MKIIYIHQYFKTPEEGGAVRSYHLAKGLVDAGHDVEMITGGNQKYYDQRRIDGIKVHYLPVTYNQKFSFFKRVYSFLSFVKQTKKLLPKLSRPDLLYISSTPLTTGLIGLWAKRELALPYIFEVRDIWPEAPIQVGAIRNTVLKKYLIFLEAKIYRNALSLVALSPGIAEHLQKVAPDRLVSLIPNFSDLTCFFPQEKKENLLRKYGLKSTLTIAYTGVLGKVNAVEELLELAEASQKKQKAWQFLIMGEGSHEQKLREVAFQKSLKNVWFIPFGSKETVNEVLSLADFAWISFAHLPVLKTNSPNKFFDALAAGKSILVNHKGWVHQLVKEYKLGVSCLPSKLEIAINELERLEADPKVLLQMQLNSRSLAERFFSKEQAVARLTEVIDPGKNPIDSQDAVYILTA